MIILYIIQSESYEHLQIFIPIPGDNVLCIVYILFSLGLYKVEIWQYIWYQGQEENWKKEDEIDVNQMTLILLYFKFTR